MSAEMPPHAVAAVDQGRTLLRELADAARHHTDAFACEYAGSCAGAWVLDALESTAEQDVRKLLYLAVAELAAAGYGLPVHLTDAALAALDRPEGATMTTEIRKIGYPALVRVVDGVPQCPHCQEPMVKRDTGWMCPLGSALLDAIAPFVARLDEAITAAADAPIGGDDDDHR